MQSKSSKYSVLWLAVGLIMATMYIINGIQASSIPYFFVAFGWLLLAAVQWWRGRAEAASSQKLALYLTAIAFLIIIGGVTARWWA